MLINPEITWPRPDWRKSGASQWWMVLQDIAATYPENPNRSDRIDYDTTLNNMFRFLPCDAECRSHTREYLSKHPITLDSRKALSKWVCEFHNSRNIEAGKQAWDCDKILSDNICPSCTKVGDEQKREVLSSSPIVMAGVADRTILDSSGDPVTQAIIKSKEAKKALFLTLCKEYNVPEPKKFNFAPCPNHPETSCISYEDPKSVEPYINQYSDSDKQVIHEFKHYLDFVKEGKRSSEEEAETFAYEKISKAYPTDLKKLEGPTPPSKEKLAQQAKEEASISETPPSPSPETGTSSSAAEQATQTTLEQPEITPHSTQATDSSPVGVANVDLIKSTQPRVKKQKLSWVDRTIADVSTDSSMAVGDLDRSLEGDSSAGFEERFPNYARAKREEELRRKDQELDKRMNQGFITYLNPVYKFPAKMLGIQEVQLNMAHTPEIIHNIIMTLVQANTTPLGSSMFSFVTGISLFFIGYLAKASISFQDQLALQNISAAFLWRTLEYINPKWEMKKALKKTFDEVQNGNFRVAETFIETPGMWKKKERKRKNPWLSMPHKLGRDADGRPAFIIPAPMSFAASLTPQQGAGMAGQAPFGDVDTNSIRSINIGGPTQGTDAPIYNLTGDTYYDTEEDYGLEPYTMGGPGYVDPDLMRSVKTFG